MKESINKQINALEKYLHSKWTEDHFPSLEQMKYELGYDVSFELGFRSNTENIDTFEKLLQKLILSGKIAIFHDLRTIKRVYPSERILINELAYKLYKFLVPIWEKTFISRKIFVYEQFTFKNHCTPSQFDKALSVLLKFKVIELLNDSSKGIRIMKPLNSNGNIEQFLRGVGS